MFSHASVILSRGGGGVHGGRHAWQGVHGMVGACMAGRTSMAGGGHAWWGGGEGVACMAGENIHADLTFSLYTLCLK